MRDHLATCPGCAELLLELHRVGAEERRPGTVIREWFARGLDLLSAPNSGDAGRAQATRWAPALAGFAAAVILAPAIFLAYRAMQETQSLALGAYSMELHGDIEAMRGEDTPDAGPFEFAPGMTFDLNLFPAEPVQGPIEVAAFLVGANGVERWPVPVAISAEGAVRIHGVVGSDIPLPAGPSVVLVAVGRPDRLPGGEALAERLDEKHVAEERDWTAWRLSVSVIEEPTTP
jgi:hypothetical protein